MQIKKIYRKKKKEKKRRKTKVQISRKYHCD